MGVGSAAMERATPAAATNSETNDGAWSATARSLARQVRYDPAGPLRSGQRSPLG
jgi:hypothetical protein